MKGWGFVQHREEIYEHTDLGNIQTLSRLETLITANPDFTSDVEGALKSALLETAINRSLFAGAAAGVTAATDEPTVASQ